MTYSQDALEEMAEKIDLVEYASKTVDFVKHTSGYLYYAVCPFHNERTASLCIDAKEQFFKCYGCGKWGNIYNWIQWTEGLTFDQAVQKIANLTGSNITDFIESDTVAFFKLLKRLSEPKKKNNSERMILDIETDYRQKYKDELPQEWLDESIPAEIMKKYEIRIDPMSNRIVYPVYSDDDEFISIKGRTRFKNYKDLKIMKYMNYHKLGGRLDYFQGMQQARESIKEKKEIIIFEGLKSVMKADSWEYHNCVSAETSKLNEYQVELLIRMQIRDVVIAFDRDVSLGKIRENVELLKRFTNVWVIYDKWKKLSEKDSPADQGKEVFDYLYENRMRL